MNYIIGRIYYWVPYATGRTPRGKKPYLNYGVLMAIDAYGNASLITYDNERWIVPTEKLIEKI